MPCLLPLESKETILSTEIKYSTLEMQLHEYSITIRIRHDDRILNKTLHFKLLINPLGNLLRQKTDFAYAACG